MRSSANVPPSERGPGEYGPRRIRPTTNTPPDEYAQVIVGAAAARAVC